MSRTSNSHWHARKELIANAQDVLLCPNCKVPYQDRRIFQCPNGHLFCEPCIARRCPNLGCRREVNVLNPIRNRQLEFLAYETNTLQVTGITTLHPPPLPPVPICHGQPGLQPPATAPPDVPVPCSLCADNLPLYGVRFRCLTCVNLQFCQSCIDEGAHEQHPIILIKTPQKAAQAQEFINCKMSNKNKVPKNRGQPMRRY